MKEDINNLLDMLFCRGKKHIFVTKEILEPIMDHSDLVWLKDFCKISTHHASKKLYSNSDGSVFEPREYSNKASCNFARLMANELCLLRNTTLISILGYFAILNYPVSLFQYNGTEYIISIYSQQLRKHILFDTQNIDSVWFARRDSSMNVTVSLITTNYKISGAADVFKYISAACGHSYFEKINLNSCKLNIPVIQKIFLALCHQFELMKLHSETFSFDTIYVHDHKDSMKKIENTRQEKSEESFDFDLIE